MVRRSCRYRATRRRCISSDRAQAAVSHKGQQYITRRRPSVGWLQGLLHRSHHRDLPVLHLPRRLLADGDRQADRCGRCRGDGVREACTESMAEERKLWQNSGRGDAPSSVSWASSRVHAMMMFPTSSSQLADGSISRRRPMSPRRTSLDLRVARASTPRPQTAGAPPSRATEDVGSPPRREEMPPRPGYCRRGRDMAPPAPCVSAAAQLQESEHTATVQAPARSWPCTLAWRPVRCFTLAACML